MLADVDLVVRSGRLADGSVVDLAVDGGYFAAMGSGVPLRGFREVDVQGAALLPGLVDVHQHIDKAYTVARSGAAASVVGAVKAMQGHLETMTVPDVVRRGRTVYERLMRAGTCAVRTHAAVDDLCGLRAVEGLVELKREYADRVRTQVIAMPRGDADLRDPRQLERLRTALRMGADGLGGPPSQSADPTGYVSAVLDLAEDQGCLVDLHVDEDQVADAATLAFLAEETLRRGLQGRVSAGHCCTLSLIPDSDADRVISALLAARVSVSTCPLTNLFLQGGGARVPGFRGLTRVADLVRAGVNVCCGSDNIRDAFNPYGNGDLVLAALLAGLACRMGTDVEQRALLRSITEAGALAMGLDDYGLRVGARADLVAFDCASVGDILAEQPRRRLVVLGGQVVGP